MDVSIIVQYVFSVLVTHCPTRVISNFVRNRFFSYSTLTCMRAFVDIDRCLKVWRSWNKFRITRYSWLPLYKLVHYMLLHSVILKIVRHRFFLSVWEWNSHIVLRAWKKSLQYNKPRMYTFLGSPRNITPPVEIQWAPSLRKHFPMLIHSLRSKEEFWFTIFSIDRIKRVH